MGFLERKVGREPDIWFELGVFASAVSFLIFLVWLVVLFFVDETVKK